MNKSRDNFEKFMKIRFRYDESDFKLDKFNNFEDTEIHEAFTIWLASEKNLLSSVNEIASDMINEYMNYGYQSDHGLAHDVCVALKQLQEGQDD